MKILKQRDPDQFTFTTKVFALLVCLCGLWGTVSVRAEEGAQQAQLFGEKCSGCHTVGKGKLVGPDLQNVVNWPTAELTAAVSRMQKMAGPLSDAETKSLVSFLKNVKAPELVKKSEEHALAEATTAAPASAEVGKELFTGSKAFVNGGPSCIACHQTEGTGGTLGPNLTNAFDKFGESALVSACEQTNFKIMKAAYKDHPVTRQEALHLTKYFGSIKGREVKNTDPPINAIGFGGALIYLAGLTLFYRRRKGDARDKLHRR
ncbi:MAG: cytochrome c [Candidatus Obscuribacterales bacterium]|nr:cytochrome c [Candidatus Obscuribacterales bacterium]